MPCWRRRDLQTKVNIFGYQFFYETDILSSFFHVNLNATKSVLRQKNKYVVANRNARIELQDSLRRIEKVRVYIDKIYFKIIHFIIRIVAQYWAKDIVKSITLRKSCCIENAVVAAALHEPVALFNSHRQK